ncbi:hypothetical protein VNO77_04510 [Canavalia gladiata]|uniref:Transmembrane protein n=1 Tax=Canavalia gladiata TaxID=3824 RepID=A0AAN9MWN4_CANGL
MATNLWDLLSESKHIIKANRRHFLTLSFIFLLPLSFSSLIIYSFLSHTPFYFPLLCSLFSLVFSNCAVISITYSAFHFFYGEPVNLSSAIKSISTSFLPLFATTIVSQFILFFIFLFYGLLLLLIIFGAEVLNVTIPFSSPYFIGFIVALPLLLVVLYFQVNLTLVPVLVVLESCWGLEPLRRSMRLIRGMKRLALSSFFFFGFFMGIFMWSCLFLTRGSFGIDENLGFGVRDWVLIVANSYFIAMLMLSSVVVNTVLYIYCKANHGEFAHEFRKDYVSLPLHDGKASLHV